MTAKPCRLIVRLDEESKSYVTKAAELREVSIGDYVRMVTVDQARREVGRAARSTIAMTPDEQLTFWNALNATPKLTKAQCELGRTMRGEK